MKVRLLLELTLLSAAVGAGCASEAAPEATVNDVESITEAIRAAAQVTCTIQTSTGNFLTAVGGGGRTTDVIHSDATRALGWEQFTLVDVGDGAHVGIKTLTGNFLTAVGGGGRSTDVIHSNATQLQAWEEFALVGLGSGQFAIETVNGHFLTAVGGGGRTTDVIHSDATNILGWERFGISCALSP